MHGFLKKTVDHSGNDLTKGYRVTSNNPYRDQLEHALVHHRSGRMHMAADLYRSILADDAKDPDALYLLSLWHLAQKDYSGAKEKLGKLTENYPDLPWGWCAMGMALRGLGSSDAAVEAFERCLSIDNSNAEAHYELGETYVKSGDLDKAVVEFRSTVSIDKSMDHAFVRLAESFYAKHQYDEAMSACHSAILSNSRSAEGYNVLGMSLKALGQTTQAADSFRTAIKVSPGFAAPYCNLAKCFLELREPGQALEMCIQAVQLNDDLPDAYCCKGEALRQLGRLDEAMESADRALRGDSDYAEALELKGAVLMDMGRPREAAELFRKAIASDPGLSSAQSRLIQTLQADPETTGSQLLRVAEDWGRKFTFSHYSPKARPKMLKRLGFVCPTLSMHPIGCLVEGLMKNVDRDRYEVFVYANHAAEDPQSNRIKHEVRVWRKILGIDDDTATEIIGDDEIDVLVDVGGHTAHNRLQVFANHAAPVQVSWLGHHGTTGLPQIDAVIGDPVVTPIELGGDYAERIVRLNRPWISYTPPRIENALSVVPATKGEPFTFGVFANSAKFNKEAVQAWAKILAETPGSRILIKSRTLVSRELQAQVYEWFAEEGVKAERVIYRQSNTWAMHFASFDQVDLLLDTFPFNTLVTTLEGLWLGIPTLTLMGKLQHSRLSGRVLEDLRLDGFVTGSIEEYIGRAVNASHDTELLRDLRAGLRQRLLMSQLCDSQDFAKAFVSSVESLL